MSIFFVQCNFGDKVTNRHSDLCEIICSGFWIYYPLNQRKKFILMIMNAQRPVYLEGVAAQCTRETFKQVTSITVFIEFYFEFNVYYCFVHILGYQDLIFILCDSS